MTMAKADIKRKLMTRIEALPLDERVSSDMLHEIADIYRKLLWSGPLPHLYMVTAIAKLLQASLNPKATPGTQVPASLPGIPFTPTSEHPYDIDATSHFAEVFTNQPEPARANAPAFFPKDFINE